MEGKKFDKGKLRYDLLPIMAEEEVVRAFMHGAEKYGDYNWKNVDNYRSRYYAASRRHWEAWRKGEKRDKDSGLHHLAHAICCAMIILEREFEEEKSQRRVIYVAHPFEGKKENIESVEKYILNFVRKYPNYVFYSPLHATGYYYFEKSYEEGMKDCLELLSRCDELLLCPGWENSRGCQIEVAWAQEHGMPIHEVEELL